MKLSEIKKLSQYLPSQNPGAFAANLSEEMLKLGMDPGNFYQELEMTSRYVDTHQTVSFSSSSVMLHSHNFYEFLYCHSTGGVEYLVGADRYRLQRGDVILIPPGISHCPLVPEQLTEPYRRDVLWISPVMIDQLEEIIPAQER